MEWLNTALGWLFFVRADHSFAADMLLRLSLQIVEVFGRTKEKWALKTVCLFTDGDKMNDSQIILNLIR